MAPSDDYTPDGTTEAPPASSNVKVTLRAFKLGTNLKVDGPIYDPKIDPPSLVIVPLPCDPYAPVNCNVASLAPDLIPENVDTSAVVADAGGTLVGFPTGGWTLRNQGYGDANAENGILRHGFYICDTTYIDEYPSDEPLDIHDPLCSAIVEFQATAGNTVPLDPGFEDFGPMDLSIPILPEGDYYLVLYVDDTLEVSELNEINNWIAAPIFIEEPNEPPVANDASFSTDEEAALTADFPVTDPDQDPLTFAIAPGPAEDGSVTDNLDGTFTYDPAVDFNGTYAFTFIANDGEFDSNIGTVTITVDPVNDAPVATDVALTTEEDTPSGVDVSATDVDGDALTFLVVDQAAHGSVTVNQDGSVTYTPEADYNGGDQFTYKANDGTLDSNIATVSITVNPVNDAPVAADGAASTDEDNAVSGDLSASDVDLDELTYSLVSGTSIGTVEVNPNGSYTYTPDPNANGDDSFTFKANDGTVDSNTATVSITINPINDPPVVTVLPIVVGEDGVATGTVVATDVDEGDTLTFSVTTPPVNGQVSTIDPETGVFTYTPDPNFNGTDSFVVTVGDSVVTVAVTVNVTVTEVNDAPVAEAGGYTTAEDTAVGGTLSATDVDGDVLTYILVAGPSNGSLSFTDQRNFSYQPNLNFFGADSFTFKANDGELDSNTATITILVQPVNDPPVAVDAIFEALENTPLTGVLVGYDVDAGDTVSFSLGTGPTSGIAVVDPATGAFTYTPGPSFIGLDSFTFVVSDTSDASATGTVIITVIDPVPNWDFIGFATPWRPGYKVNAGSAVPLKWYYADPASGVLVDSSTPPPPAAQLEIRIVGYPGCDLTGVPLVSVEDPGSSDLRYVDGNWQFNWDTAGLPKGCYQLSVYHPITNQIDRFSDGGDPLDIQLK